MSIFEEVAASDLSGLIFSCVLDFDSAVDCARAECYIAPFVRRHWRVLFVELAASLETRLERNKTEHRKHHKIAKRDSDFTETLLRNGERYRTNSDGDFPYSYAHLKIVNETYSATEVAAQICAHFELEIGV